MSPNLSDAIGDLEMSIYNIGNMSKDTLKKLAEECISLNDVYDECSNCGRPTLLHKEDECTRTVEETAEVVAKNWSDLRKRLKPILKEIQGERRKEAEQTVYLDGIEHLMHQIHGQNTSNMMTLIQSLKDSLPKTEGRVSNDTGTARTAKIMKPVKVPTWTKDLTL